MFKNKADLSLAIFAAISLAALLFMVWVFPPTSETFIQANDKPTDLFCVMVSVRVIFLFYLYSLKQKNEFELLPLIASTASIILADISLYIMENAHNHSLAVSLYVWAAYMMQYGEKHKVKVDRDLEFVEKKKEA